MSHQSYQHLLNTLALEMKTALALAAQPALSRADKCMANIRYNRAVDQVRKLGFYPKFVERPDGGVEVKYLPLQKEEDMAEKHMYQHGDVDDRDFSQQTAVVVCPTCSLHYAQEDHDTCPRCLFRQLRQRDENFFRSHRINPFAKQERRAAREAKRMSWLSNDRTEVVICEDGEYLIDLHDDKKTRLRGTLHRKGE